MSLGDPQWELIDPTPNVYSLFTQFDNTFFWSKLANRAIVRWSKRMYSCAGVCTYEGRGGLCTIGLSEPLLKLRPRKDLIETLLHEMIHAYLFITGGDRDRDGHGPQFQSHMHRINRQAGLKISIYHDFHDEVKLYLTHWWRCDGPCQQKKPYFGIVRRSSNRAPGPSDFWWEDHRRNCSGTFIKIKEPEKKTKNTTRKATSKNTLKNVNTNNNNNKISSPNIKTFPILNAKSPSVNIKSNNGNTVVVTHKNTNSNLGCPCNDKTKSVEKNIALWVHKGYTIADNKKRNSTPASNVAEVVRNVWANKKLTSNDNNNNNKPNSINKRKSLTVSDTSPPVKVKKIDDYFKTSPKKPVTSDIARSILKDVYGEDFKLYTNENSDSKIVAIQNPTAEQVNCPICNDKVKNTEINKHIDECLNKEEIERVSNGAKHETILADKIEIKFRTTSKEEHVKSQPEVKESIIHNKQANIKTENVIVRNVNIHEISSTIKPQKEYVFDSKPSTSREIFQTGIEAGVDLDFPEQKCPCCTQTVNVPMEEHLDECLSFMDDNRTIPEEGNSILNNAIEIVSLLSDNDDLDESSTFNETGTKYPCPCCLKMVEQDNMNVHLDKCLQ